MKLFIPPLKTELRLMTAWKFNLHNESRNKTFYQLFKLPYIDRWTHGWNKSLPGPVPVTLPKGTILILERIYIRNGAGSFDSLTFRIKQLPNPPKTGKKTARFWARLEDCNGMNIQVLLEEDLG